MMTTGSGIFEMSFFPSNFILQSPHDDNDHNNHHHHYHHQHHHHQPPSSLSFCSPHDFHAAGVAPMLGKRTMSTSAIDICEESKLKGGGRGMEEEEEDLSDDGSQAGAAGEKKRRLNMEQVRTLERSFEQGNKLEPERKLQLAKALGLKPRQIAIWFQNRRARSKTKQLEKDYEILKEQFDSLKAVNEVLHSQNQKLQAEILALKSKEPTNSINLNKETDQGSCSNRSENSTDEIKLDTTRTPTTTAESIDSYPTLPPNHHHHHNQVHHVVAQLFPKPADIQCHRFDHPVKEESLTNMFSGIDDQSGLWPWLEQHNFT